MPTYFPFPLPDPPQPAGTTLTSYGGRKHHIKRKAETESTLALAENVYVNLPTPKGHYGNTCNDFTCNDLQFKSKVIHK